jgi:hypothetical protein
VELVIPVSLPPPDLPLCVDRRPAHRRVRIALQSTQAVHPLPVDISIDLLRSLAVRNDGNALPSGGF